MYVSRWNYSSLEVDVGDTVEFKWGGDGSTFHNVVRSLQERPYVSCGFGSKNKANWVNLKDHPSNSMVSPLRLVTDVEGTYFLACNKVGGAHCKANVKMKLTVKEKGQFLKDNKCVCSNGTPKQGPECRNHLHNECASCQTDFVKVEPAKEFLDNECSGA